MKPTTAKFDHSIKVIKATVVKAPIAQVKNHLSEMVDRAHKGEIVVILRRGRPVARLIPLAKIGERWRVPTPDAPSRYKGVNLNEPILGIA